MKIEEIFNEKYSSVSGKRNRMYNFRPKAKSSLLFVAMATLCIGSYYFGSRSNKGRVESLEQQLDVILARLDGASRDHKPVKREAEKAAHRLTKRNARDPRPEQVFTGLGGVTYTRWGRRNCPDNERTSLVYEGVAAGSHYGHNGGGSDVLCLDLNVVYTPGKYVEGNQGSSYIYGLEYRDGAWADGLFNLSLIEGNDFRLHDVPCAVCMGRTRVNQLMIPGRDTCPAGWTFEYSGYILSSAHGHTHSSPHLCVDDTPQVVPGSDGDQGGELLYIVETQCPSLQCEPFVTGRELRCVVCTI